MTIAINYPGIYISEEISLNLSLTNTPTAVPAFAFVRYSHQHPPAENISRFENWAEFRAIVKEDDTGGEYYDSIRLWFINGGGYCYLVDTSFLVEAVEKHDDITLVVEAGTFGKIFEQCNTLVERGYPIFSLFDGPRNKITAADSPDNIMSSYPVSPYAAVWYPWIKTSWGNNTIPPSTVAAVAIARSDRTRGVWKAPANQVINDITPDFPVSDDLQGRFSQGKALNMIRHFPGSGTMLWGARTLEDSDNWRYIPVRRLFNMVEHDVQQALRSVVFEANSQPTWQKVKVTIDNYLHRLWQQGALAGCAGRVSAGRGLVCSGG